MTSVMDRRVGLVVVLIVSLTLWLLAVEAQQSAIPVIGFVRSGSLKGVETIVAAFRQGLKETGYVDGQNVAIEFRSADDHHERLPAIVAELIRRPAAVLVPNAAAAEAARAATTTVPIVFATGGVGDFWTTIESEGESTVLRVMCLRWTAEAWSVVRVEFKKALAPRSEIRRAGWSSTRTRPGPPRAAATVRP